MKLSFTVSLCSKLICKNRYGSRCLSTFAFLHGSKVINIVKGKKVEFFNSCFRNRSDHCKIIDSQPFPPKKRHTKKKKVPIKNQQGFHVFAFSTAEEYHLENLLQGLHRFSTFKPTSFSSEFGNLTDVIHAVDNSVEESESKHLFFFREGSVVMWNVSESQVVEVLKFVKLFEDNSFKDEVVKQESEVMTYSISSDINKTGIVDDKVVFSANADLRLEKYAISNAMSLSVHLGTYEAYLEQYIETMEPITEDLKAGAKIKMTRHEVLRKTGQLFALRHNISLSSDLLDTPDFYWDRENLEKLYQAMFNYFSINKRTRVMNERINHCIELVELLSSHLNDKHHVRLEWMIIILIMVEVAFEIFHYVEKYMNDEENQSTYVAVQS